MRAFLALLIMLGICGYSHRPAKTKFPKLAMHMSTVQGA